MAGVNSRISGWNTNSLGIFCPKNPRVATDWGQVNAVGLSIPDQRQRFTLFGQSNSNGIFVNPTSCKRRPGVNSVCPPSENTCPPSKSCGAAPAAGTSCAPNCNFPASASNYNCNPNLGQGKALGQSNVSYDNPSFEVGSDSGECCGPPENTCEQESASQPLYAAGYQHSYHGQSTQSLGTKSSAGSFSPTKSYILSGRGPSQHPKQESSQGSMEQSESAPQAKEVEEHKYNSILGEGESYNDH